MKTKINGKYILLFSYINANRDVIAREPFKFLGRNFILNNYRYNATEIIT